MLSRSIIHRLKRPGIVLVQLLVTAGGIYYVFHDPRTRAQIAEALGQTRRGWLTLGWFCYCAVELLASARWLILFRIQGIRLGWARTLGIVMIGLFFNMFLPGLIGGDAARLYFAFRCVPNRKAAVTLSVVMDRWLGLLSVLLLGAASLGLRFDWFEQAAVTLHIAYLTLILLGGSALLIVVMLVILSSRWDRKFPEGTAFRSAIAKVSDVLKLYRKHSGVVASTFLITVVSHFAYYLSYFCAAKSLTGAGSPPTLADMLSIMPLVNTITSLPISFGGAGVRETLFQQLLGHLAHVPPGIAAFAASLGFAIQASWGILGAAVYLLAQRIDHHTVSVSVN